jgi:hypothetical protein
MSDAVIAAIARRVAVAAAVNVYERKADTSKEFLQALTELCAAVKAERNEAEQQR